MAIKLSRFAALLLITIAVPCLASPVGDTFDLGLHAYYNDAIGGWVWGEAEGPDGADFSGSGGLVGNFTFGTQGEFSLLGNILNVDSEVIDTGATTETWQFTISDADGGPIFDPVDGLAENGGFWRAWHLREISIGGFGRNIDDGEGGEVYVWNAGDMIESDSFVDFASGVGVEAWTSAGVSSTFYNGDELAETPQLAYTSWGDLDGDGLVNENDYQSWVDNYGRDDVEQYTDGDANGDFVVDAADFTLISDYWGTDTRMMVDGQAPFYAWAQQPLEADSDVIGVNLNRQYGNPGMILYDDGIWADPALNPEVTKIVISVDVITKGAAVTASSVPEPSSACLAMLVTLSLGMLRRRRA